MEIFRGQCPKGHEDQETCGRCDRNIHFAAPAVTSSFVTPELSDE